MFKFIFKFLSFIIVTFTLIVIGAIAICIIYTYPKLPHLDKIINYQPKTPLKIYSYDGKLLGIYGTEQRSFMKINLFPQNLINAVIAAEDKRFYSHHGVDPIGIIRALIANFFYKEIKSGASTLTQQIARNFFLNNKKTYNRKFNEILLAIKVEKSLTKDKILELYFNQIFLGKRAYGFVAASFAYYNKPVQDLSLAESAMLAALPKGPSAFNPIDNPERAKSRQLYVLNNMLKLKFINQEQYQKAIDEQIHYNTSKFNVDDNGLYVAEMVRNDLYYNCGAIMKCGEEIYTAGYQVYTTIDYKAQKVATDVFRKALIANPTRDSFQGAEEFIDISNKDHEHVYKIIKQKLYNKYAVNNLIPAVVINVNKHSITLHIKDQNNNITLTGDDLNYIKPYVLNEKYGVKQVRSGSILRVVQKNGKWQISQLPVLQGALVSIDPNTGAIKTLVGGFDFYEKQFNRATQAQRQPGSTFKPFIYSAGLEFGFTSASLIEDLPLTIGKWSPKNADGKYTGLLTLSQGLISSKNMISIRILQAIGIDYTLRYLHKFGFLKKTHPHNFTLALGAGSTTPLQLAESYSVFANGGYKVQTYLIDKVLDSSGNIIAISNPQTVAPKNAKLVIDPIKTKLGIKPNYAQLVIDPRNAFIIYNILKNVVNHGTGRRALSLRRTDIAGKTGTTNNQKDAWFVGFNSKLVTVVFIGYDTPKSMGRIGYGASIALPVWVNYMKFALKDIPKSELVMPKNVVKLGNDYFYKERQTTSTKVKLNNSSSNYNNIIQDDIIQDKSLDNLF